MTRFLLLSELCRKLGEFGCMSYLVNPASGSAVLRVNRAGHSQDKLCVAAVERREGWVYAWDGHWEQACYLEQVARQIVLAVAS